MALSVLSLDTRNWSVDGASVLSLDTRNWSVDGAFCSVIRHKELVSRWRFLFCFKMQGTGQQMALSSVLRHEGSVGRWHFLCL